VLLFTTAVTLLTAIAFGLAPGPMVARSKLQDVLKDGARGSGSRSRGSRRVLVVAEVALAVVLLSGSGLLIKSVAKLLSESAGVDPASTITADMQLAGNAYRDLSAVDLFYSNLVAGLRSRPEVTAAGITDFLPLEVGWRQPFTVVGGDAVAASDAPQAQFHSVDEGYFSALRIPVIRGRGVDSHDRADATAVVIVNQALADRIWPGRDPVGQHITTTTRQVGPLGRRIVAGDDHEVIGVVGNVKNISLKTAAEPAIYFVQHQFPFRNMHVVLRGRGEPAQLAALLRDEVRKLDAALPVANVKLMERVLAESADPPRFVMLLMSAFAILALLLAAIGIYGILSYSVAHRKREIGVRMALGAMPGDVLRMVLSEGVLLAVIGSLIGTFGAYAGGKAVSGLLYQVKPWDPITLGLVVVLVLAVASIASFAPGWRASSADPAGALRAE
jgi:predicted permease